MTAPDEHVDPPRDEAESWHDVNNRYLGVSLLWLRLCLTRLATPAVTASGGAGDRGAPAVDRGASSPTPPPTATPVPKKRGFWHRRGEVADVPPAPAVMPGAETPSPVAPRRDTARSTNVARAGPSIDQQIADAAARMAELEATATAPALVLLTKRFGLSPFERDVLLLCIAMDLDTRTAGLCASAQGDPTTRFPTFALALTLFENPAWEALAPDRPLRFWRLIEVRGGPLEPLTTSPLLADERVVNYCKGLNTPDGRLAELFVPLAFSAPDVSDVAPSQRPQLELIVRRLTGEGDTAPPIIHLIGPDRASKQALAQGVADRFRLPLVRLPVESLPTSLTELEELLRLLRRESALLPVALYVDAYDANVSTEGAPPSVNLNRVLGQRAGVTLLDTRDVVPGVELDTLLIEVQSPTPAEQRDAWATALGL
ncbi:MAG TPA: hypothetical protein VGF22_16805, partial [Acidimicrobiales bacterium]